MAATKAAKRQVPDLSYSPQISILGINTKPDNSGNCWAEPYSLLATNDVWDPMIWRFGASNSAQPTTRIGLHGSFVVPQNYVSFPSIYIHWTSTIITGNVVWDFECRTVGGDDTTSLDQTGTEESLTLTDAAPGAANRRLTPGLSLTGTNFAAGETVEFALFRDGVDAADTMAGSAILFDLIFSYVGSL